jgi:hypothetical protein
MILGLMGVGCWVRGFGFTQQTAYPILKGTKVEKQLDNETLNRKTRLSFQVMNRLKSQAGSEFTLEGGEIDI